VDTISLLLVQMVMQDMNVRAQVGSTRKVDEAATGLTTGLFREATSRKHAFPTLGWQSTLLMYILLKKLQQDLKGNRPGHIIAGDLESDDDKHKPKDDGRVKHLESEVRGVVFAAVCKHFIILCECECS
jgi:hypothetical protein